MHPSTSRAKINVLTPCSRSGESQWFRSTRRLRTWPASGVVLPERCSTERCGGIFEYKRQRPTLLPGSTRTWRTDMRKLYIIFGTLLMLILSPLAFAHNHHEGPQPTETWSELADCESGAWDRYKN